MQLREMRLITASELARFPRDDFVQDLFRSVYWNRRMHSLGRKATIPNSLPSWAKWYP